MIFYLLDVFPVMGNWTPNGVPCNYNDGCALTRPSDIFFVMPTFPYVKTIRQRELQMKYNVSYAQKAHREAHLMKKTGIPRI